MKKIDFEKGSFKAGGKTYYIQTEGIPVARYKHYERLSLEAAFNVSFQDMYNLMKQIYTKVTSGDESWKETFHDVAELSWNALNGIKEHLEERQTKVLMLCTLFVNTKDEGVEWNESLAKEKIEDWKDIDTMDFFLLFHRAVNGFREALLELTENPPIKPHRIDS